MTPWTEGEAGEAHSAAPGPLAERRLMRRGSPRAPCETDDEGDDGGRVRLGEVVPDDDAGADDDAHDGDALNGPVAARPCVATTR